MTRDEMWAVAHGSRLVRPPARADAVLRSPAALNRARPQAELLRVRLGNFHVTRFQDLVAQLERLPWSAYIHRGLPQMPSVSAVAAKSKLIHTGYHTSRRAPQPPVPTPARCCRTGGRR